MKPRSRDSNSVKIALVLLLFGFLLGGLLRAKTAVDARRAQLLEEDFRSVAHDLLAYQQQYGALPGDDPKVGTVGHLPHAAACAPIASGKCLPGNGIIDGNWNDGTTASESYLFWQHVRMAGLAEGATDPAAANYPAQNGEGGRLGLTNGNESPIVELHDAQIVCSDRIKASLAKQLDATLDNGDTASGKVMATLAGTTSGGHALAGDALAEGRLYLVCMGI